MPKAFTLPELGENIAAGTVTNVLVKPGDTVADGQPVIELETDKAVLEVPCTLAGVVSEVQAKVGDTLKVGDVVMMIEEGASASPAPKPAPQQQELIQEEVAPVAAKTESEPPKPAPQRQEPSPVPAKEASAPAAEPAPPAKRSVQGQGPVPASPSVRRLAREIGVDVHQVPGSGPGGRISEEDVKTYAREVNTDVRGITAPAPAAAAGVATPSMPLPDFSRWGHIDRESMSGVRKRTAENMAYAWSTIPMVTQFDKADVTELERLRKQYGPRVAEAGGKLTMTAILLKVLPVALKKFPQCNASIDVANNEIIYKRYYNIGVAVDTDRGLIVPSVKQCDTKSLVDICVEMNGIAARARDRKTTLDEMQGGTFTVSNLGGIGGTAFTPIVNPPEVAILGVSRASVEPVWRDGQFVPRTMLPLSLSYDHRVIDGADGARFLRWICEALEQPFLLFLEG